ncbi:hypothetical protein DFJ73DRAFT_827816 [Zopfochytrium polystomum]|nr:hypothetical protein DFJ73DRAFT_827816 [Zopfochytrium polystomum]
MGAFGVAAGDSALAQAFRLDLFYCIGAAEAVLDEFTDRVVAGSRYLGCGAGALVAAVMALGLGKTGLDRLMDAAAQWESESRSTLLGPLTTTAAFLRAQLDEVLPITTPDLTGRLFVSVTRFPSMENELLTKLPNKQCIIDAIMASCYQPVIHESPIRLEESVRHMDTHAVAGSYSNRLPQYDGRTITVSRVPGEANASPSLDRAQRVTPKADGPESATEFARRQGDADGRTYLEGLKASGSITLCAFKGF